MRLLAYEVYEKFNAINLPCNLLTGEAKIIRPSAQLSSSTIEMADYDKHYSIVVVDEAQYVCDNHRGHHWTKASKIFLYINL